MKNPHFLNVFNIATALHLLETGKDYQEINDNHTMVVAYDNTVWVCNCGESVSLRDAKMVQRII